MIEITISILTGLITTFLGWIVVRYWYIPIRDNYNYISELSGSYKVVETANPSINLCEILITAHRDSLIIKGEGISQDGKETKLYVDGYIAAKSQSTENGLIIFGDGLYIDKRPSLNVYYRGQYHIVAFNNTEIAVHAPYLEPNGEIKNQDHKWIRINDTNIKSMPNSNENNFTIIAFIFLLVISMTAFGVAEYLKIWGLKAYAEFGIWISSITIFTFLITPIIRNIKSSFSNLKSFFSKKEA